MSTQADKPAAPGKVRVRFAPSPSGYLHVGNARTALFNWLFARKHRGTLVLRVEDTDAERSTEDSLNTILSDLRWLKLDWDEGPDVGGKFGPYKQSLRMKIYERHLAQLKQKNAVYPCYCTAQELEDRRKTQLAAGKPPAYDGRCGRLDDAKRQTAAKGLRPSWRFRVPDKKITVQDLVRGTVAFDGSTLGDFVIVKADGTPTFHFAVCVDDALMGITHVIRGEDHLSNTPRHILLFEAMGYAPPAFAHLSMILGPDGSRLSKRHGASSVMELRKLGYLPETLDNYLALLGWSLPDNQEIADADKMIAAFDLKDVNKSAAIFDMEKLGWVNSQYMRKAPEGKIADLALPYLREAKLVEGKLAEEDFAFVRRVIRLVLPYVRNLAQLPEQARVFLREGNGVGEDVQKILAGARIKDMLSRLAAALDGLQEWEPKKMKAFLSAQAKTMGVGGKDFYMPVRAALTGRLHGPELMDILPLLGKERCLRRLRETAGKIKNT